MKTSKVTVAVGIIRTIERDRDGYVYLIGQIKPHRKHPSQWEFPGGKLENGESVSEALVRELYEELDIAIIPGRFLCSHEFSECEVVFLLVDKFYGEPVPLDHDALRWETMEELSSRTDLIDSFMLDALRRI